MSYDPTYQVKLAHKIPPVSNFDSSSQYYNNLYIFPAIYLVFGVLAVFIYQGILFINCAQSGRIKRGNQDEEMIPISFYDIACKIIFYLSIMSALTLNSLLFLWYFNLSNGIQTVAASLGSASSSLSPIVTSTDTLTSQLNMLYSLINKTVCETAFASVGIERNLTIATLQAKAGVSGINTAICNAPSVFSLAQSQVSTSYILLKDTLLLGMFAVITVVTAAVGIASLTGSKGWLVSSVLTSEALVLVLTVLCSFEMLAVHLLADFCMNPSASASSFFASDCFGSVVPYYTACGSTVSPYTHDYSSAHSAALWLRHTLNPHAYAATANQLTLLGTSDKCLVATNTQIDIVYRGITNLTSTLNCDSVYSSWTSAVDDTICDSGFSDILNIWITHCLVAGVLFAAAVANGRYRELWRNGYMFSISRRPFIRSAAKKESLKSPNTKAREKRRRAKVPSNQVSKQVQQQGLVGPLSPGSDAMGGGELSEADFLHYGIRGSMFNRAVIMEDLNNIAEVVEEEPLDDDEDEDEDIDEEYGEEEATTVCEEEPVVEEDMVPEPTAELSDGPIINPIVVTENASRWVANEADYPEGGESL